ncbi:outer membrane protein [Rhodopseudomonas sp. B29]|uniref:outer membrane protein n=1 Tax=Rhodopseudomonas sp. B29 TaxID=95607 RepID=UPI00034BC4A9|nr:outer membrane beta-barrel protein [Rhodopseudomonas sp. B29]
MKRILVSTLAVVALAAPAVAADLAPRTYTKAPVIAPVPGWAGFYIGGNVGGGWGKTTFDSVAGGDHYLLNGQSFSTNTKAGVVGGVQVGYNWQFQQFVVGLEGTYSGSDIKNSTGIFADPVFGGQNVSFESKIDSYATIVGRLGWTPDNTWLLYAKGGWATGHVKSSVQDYFPLPATLQHWSGASKWQDGWTVGAGVEYKLTSNWILGVEYNYLNLSSKNHSGPINGVAPGAPLFYSEGVKADINAVTARVSYLFH